MTTIAEVYFARVDGPDIGFSPTLHAREDLIAESATFSQIRGDAATIEIRCLYPETGLIGGPRWGILSARVAGVVREIARGQIVGYPVALAGQLVTVELVCKSISASQRVDNLFIGENSAVPRQVDPSEDPRRTEPYMLCDVYHDPRTLVPSLDPIAGSAPPVMSLFGEGAPVGERSIDQLELSISDAPVDLVTLIETTAFEQSLWKKVDLGSAISMIPSPARVTYTPESLRSAVESITLDGGYELKSADIEFSPGIPFVIYTDKRKVDPGTCAVIPAKSVKYTRNTIADLRLTTFINAAQDRREILEVPVQARISDIGGAVQLTETSAISDAERFAETTHSLTYETYRANTGIGGGTLTTTHWTTRYGVGSRVWDFGGGPSADLQACLRAMVRRAARIAVERAHCVRLTILTEADQVLDLTLKDRVRVYDNRLPGGVAVGKITGIEMSFGITALATIFVSCPLSDPADLSPVTAGGGLDGLAQITINPTFSHVDPVPNTGAMNAVDAGAVNSLVTSIEILDGVVEQEAACGGTDPVSEQIPDPESVMPKTGIEMSFLDLSPLPVDILGDRRLTLTPVIIRLPEGISL